MALGTWVDGSPAAEVPADDRGLAYGDGLFETFVLRHGRIAHWPLHLARLSAGCRRLGMDLPDPAPALAPLCEAASVYPRAVGKLLLTRGSGGRGYRPPLPASPRLISALHAWPDYPSERRGAGVVVRVCSQRVSTNPDLAGLKHLNRLDNVLARGEWDDEGIAEGLMCDADGYLIEGTMTNLFLVHGDRLSTPLLDRAGVAGITRGRIIDWAGRTGRSIGQRRLTLDDMNTAEEAFVCNSVIGVWPLRQVVGGADFSAPGPLTTVLMNELETV